VEAIQEDVLDFADFIEWGVAVVIHGEGFSREGIFNGELRDMLREVLLEHQSEDAAHKLHDTVIEIRGVVLRHVRYVGRSRAVTRLRQTLNVLGRLNDYEDDQQQKGSQAKPRRYP